MRTHKMSLHECRELRRVKKSCENLKSWHKLRWDEKRWEKLRWHEKRWEQLWSAEKSWERERRHQMGWDEVKKLRRHEMSWDEMGWHRLWWQRDAMSNFREKLRCDEIRWNEKRFNIRKAWHQIDKSRACCCDAQEACRSPIGTVFVPLYRLYISVFKFETSAPGLLGYYLYSWKYSFIAIIFRINGYYIDTNEWILINTIIPTNSNRNGSLIGSLIFININIQWYFNWEYSLIGSWNININWEIFINRIMGILISIGNIHARYPGLVAAAHQPLRSPLRVILGGERSEGTCRRACGGPFELAKMQVKLLHSWD